MASSYTTDLRIEKMANGDASGTWGTKTNTNWDLIEQAIAGVASVAMTDAEYTLSTANAASDEARNAVITMTGTLTGTQNVIVPSVDKCYTIKNSTTGGYSIVVKTAAGTGITILNGETEQLYCDATNVLLASTTHTGTGAPVRGTSPTINGRTVFSPTLMTPQASTSGTSIDFTSIPAGVTKITVMLKSVSIDSGDHLLIQIGDSGGVETTNYTAATAAVNGNSAATTTIYSSTTGAYLRNSTATAAQLWYGAVQFMLENSTANTWVISGVVRTDAGMLTIAGYKDLSATLDRVRVTSSLGASNFDAGEINVMYE